MANFDQYAQTYRRVLDHSLALSGETSHYFADYKARYVASALDSTARRQKILDFGCGVGLLTAALKKHLPSVIHHGYDVSPESIGNVETSLAQSCHFTTDLASLDNDYDAILMAAVLHHVPVNQRIDIMRELTNRLTGNGKIFVFEHNPLNPVTRWVVRRCPFDCDAILIKPSDVVAHLREVGLHFLRRDYLVFFPRLLSRLRPIEQFLGWCPAGAQYVITATKGPLTHSHEIRNTESSIRR